MTVSPLGRGSARLALASCLAGWVIGVVGFHVLAASRSAKRPGQEAAAYHVTRLNPSLFAAEVFAHVRPSASVSYLDDLPGHEHFDAPGDARTAHATSSGAADLDVAAPSSAKLSSVTADEEPALSGDGEFDADLPQGEAHPGEDPLQEETPPKIASDDWSLAPEVCLGTCSAGKNAGKSCMGNGDCPGGCSGNPNVSCVTNADCSAQGVGICTSPTPGTCAGLGSCPCSCPPGGMARRLRAKAPSVGTGMQPTRRWPPQRTR